MTRLSSSTLRLIPVIGAILFLLAGCKSDLYSKLPEQEANEMIALLERSGIAAVRSAAKDGTITVRVDEESFASAVTALNEAGLPRHKFASMGDVFADTKLISSPTEESARFVYALSQELSKTLSEIDGVISARVHLVLPKKDPLKEQETPSSASVFIKYDPNIPVTPLLPQIKTLVTNSVEGLSYDKVSVVFVPAERKQKSSETMVVKSQQDLMSVLTNFGPLSPVLIIALGFIVLAIGTFAFLSSRRRKGNSSTF